MQELVDDFYMKDAWKPIKGLVPGPIRLPGNKAEMGTYNGVTVSKMCIDRSPFLQHRHLRGMKWRMSK